MQKKSELEEKIAELEKKERHCSLNHREMETSLSHAVKFEDELSACVEKFVEAIKTGSLDGRGQVLLDSRHDGWYPPYAGGVMIPLSFEKTKALAELFTDLRRAFGEFGDRRFREGLQRGQNILVQLAKGEMTISDFDAVSEKRKTDESQYCDS